jgi:hypothetical protein
VVRDAHAGPHRGPHLPARPAGRRVPERRSRAALDHSAHLGAHARIRSTPSSRRSTGSPRSST